MRNTKTCPKCGSVKVTEVPYQVRGFGATYICIPPGMSGNEAVCPKHYLCCNCGYMEEWTEEQYLNSLWETWGRSEHRRFEEHETLLRIETDKERVRNYRKEHPEASKMDAAKDLSLSFLAVNRFWMPEEK